MRSTENVEEIPPNDESISSLFLKAKSLKERERSNPNQDNKININKLLND